LHEPVGLAKPRPGSSVVAVIAAAMMALASIAFAREVIATAGRSVPHWIDVALAPVAPFNSFNGYGLFRVMTTERPEIIVETSGDGETWAPVEFRFKPGDVSRRPPMIAPYMPRLDWQMWFAALDPRGASGWLVPFLARVSDGSGPVQGLLAPRAPATPAPRLLRLALYRYRFTLPAERRGTGNWWTREFVAHLTGPLSSEELRPYLQN